jgi:hypothetical protein
MFEMRGQFLLVFKSVERFNVGMFPFLLKDEFSLSGTV